MKKTFAPEENFSMQLFANKIELRRLGRHESSPNIKSTN